MTRPGPDTLANIITLTLIAYMAGFFVVGNVVLAVEWFRGRRQAKKEYRAMKTNNKGSL